MMGLDTYITPHSYDIARLAAGGALRAVDAVLGGETNNAIAALRPPGHHATASNGMGFCLLNHAALAARHAQTVYGIERVLILDYDVHHGNGTQDIFYDDPGVLYISTHESPLYPGTGHVSEVGQGAGAGFTMNIPLPAGVGDAGYASVFAELVLPAAQRFAPQLVLVSAGFDAHWADPLAHMRLSLTGYDDLTRRVIQFSRQMCAGRIVFVMEGGYNLEVLGTAWVNVTRALLDEGAGDDPLGPAPGREVSIEGQLQRIRQLHKLI
jgi:acetoin utilization deacetylase AcuC-like enzyme